MSLNNSGKTGYPTSVAPFYGRDNKQGTTTYASIKLTDEIVKVLHAIEPGGKLELVVRSDEQKSDGESKNPADAFLDYITPGQVQERLEFFNQGKGKMVNKFKSGTTKSRSTNEDSI